MSPVATTQIKDFAGLTSQLDQSVFPMPVQAERHHVVEQIVPARDGGNSLFTCAARWASGL